MFFFMHFGFFGWPDLMGRGGGVRVCVECVVYILNSVSYCSINSHRVCARTLLFNKFPPPLYVALCMAAFLLLERLALLVAIASRRCVLLRPSSRRVGRGSDVGDERVHLAGVLKHAPLLGDAARHVHRGGVRQLDGAAHIVGGQPARQDPPLAAAPRRVATTRSLGNFRNLGNLG